MLYLKVTSAPEEEGLSAGCQFSSPSSMMSTDSSSTVEEMHLLSPEGAPSKCVMETAILCGKKVHGKDCVPPRYETHGSSLQQKY